MIAYKIYKISMVVEDTDEDGDDDVCSLFFFVSPHFSDWWMAYLKLCYKSIENTGSMSQTDNKIYSNVVCARKYKRRIK